MRNSSSLLGSPRGSLNELEVVASRDWRIEIGSLRVEKGCSFDESTGPEQGVERHGEPEWESIEEVEVAFCRREVSVIALSILDETEDGTDLGSKETSTVNTAVFCVDRARKVELTIIPTDERRRRDQRRRHRLNDVFEKGL